ncbi:MAG: DUF3365 domain-containing protein [Pseudomonadota bacterium]
MKHASLQTQLVARLLIILTGFGILLFFSLNLFLRNLMETEVIDKGRLIFAHLLAVQTYVRETLRPAMYEALPPGAFVMESMSTSYVTRKVMTDLNTARSQFSYRRVATEPRNPEYAANELEQELIRYFKGHPDEQNFSRFRNLKNEECYITARPVVFEKSCMACHGRLEDAPAVLLTRYGSERGFGRREGEIGGLDILIVPIERNIAVIRQLTLTFILIFACGTLFIIGFNHFFFDRIMLQNINRLATVLRSRFPDEAKDSLQGNPRNGDEIESMVSDMEQFADHLRSARSQLSDYALNLEIKVKARTAEVSREAEARLKDLQLFLDILDIFAKDMDRQLLLDCTLSAIASRFNASSAAIHCFYSMNRRSWPAGMELHDLEVSQRDMLVEGKDIYLHDTIIVPVISGTAIRGALDLRWDSPVAHPPRQREVLLAVGHQLGIALENLDAMENILRQKAVLESIFEGIADPLFLLDSAGVVLHANESAQRLISDLPHMGENGKCHLDFTRLSAEADLQGEAVQRDIVLPTGSSLTLRSYPLRAMGGVGRTIVFARDTTVEKTMLARLQKGEKSLAVAQLAAGLAHEINNPLGVILCYARLLWDDGKNPQAPDLEIIIRHTLQAQKVLNDLMRFARSKPEAGQIDLNEAMAFIARVFHVRADSLGIRIVTDIQPNLPGVRGDEATVEQILSNIVINSLDALEEHPDLRPGRITLSAFSDLRSGEVILTITDNGPGIPEPHLSRVFDPFFTTKEVGRGTGLGLSVVYGLVKDMEGRIEVQSHDGAIFTITFKAAGEKVSDDPTS